jgi:2'-5' RNA ligase
MDDRVPSKGEGRPRSLRVFFAIWPDAMARERMAVLAADVARTGGGRAVDARNLHITVAFVGAVAADRADALRIAGADATRCASAFDIALERLGGARDGELVWLAPVQVPAPLVALHTQLDAALQQQRFATERRQFRPHLTLARRCTRNVPHVPVEPITWHVTHLALIASTTASAGSEYRELAQWRLG